MGVCGVGELEEDCFCGGGGRGVGGGDGNCDGDGDGAGAGGVEVVCRLQFWKAGNSEEWRG